jgi:hypothetical protein
MADGTIVASTKVCTRCGETKAATPEFFHRDRATRDGLCVACKSCRYQPRGRRRGPPRRSLEANRRCTRCSENKPATTEFFYPKKGCVGGINSICKKCDVQAHRQRYPPTGRPPGRRAQSLGSVRRCNKCAEAKPATEVFFSPKNGARGGLYSICKICDAQRAALYRIDNPTDNQSPARLAAIRRWRAKQHPERLRELAREHQKRRRKDGRYRASAAMSLRIWLCLKGKRGASWGKLVGYTRSELVTHLERQFRGRMSWPSFGRVWHIDHIRPISSFQFSNYEDQGFQDCWALSNLRPLLKRENLIKHNQRTHLI